MALYATYDPATGKILKSGVCAGEDMEAQAKTGQAVIERTDFDQHDGNSYVDLTGPDPVIADRPVMEATIDGMTITGIPTGAVLTIEGVNYTVDDGEAELTFGLPGTYQVKLSLWPYLDKTFEVVAP